MILWPSANSLDGVIKSFPILLQVFIRVHQGAEHLEKNFLSMAYLFEADIGLRDLPFRQWNKPLAALLLNSGVTLY